MRITAWGIVGLFLVIVSTMALWPENANFGSPSTAIAQEVETEQETAKAKPSAAVAEKSATQNPAAQKSVTPTEKALPSSASTLQARNIRSILEGKCNLEFEEVQFSDITAELQDRLRVNILLDQTAMDDALTNEELVTVRLRGVRYSTALRLMLRSFNATYVVNSGVIRIISLDNVNDPENLSQRMIRVKSVLQQIRQNVSDENMAISPEDQLAQTITSVVQPHQWSINGKGKSAISIVGGILVVRGPESLMDETTDFIQDLQAELSAQE